jgi:hypothetical protein
VGEIQNRADPLAHLSRHVWLRDPYGGEDGADVVRGDRVDSLVTYCRKRMILKRAEERLGTFYRPTFLQGRVSVFGYIPKRWH